MKELCVNLSIVYDNVCTEFDGLRIGERGIFSDDANFGNYTISNLVGLSTTCNRPYIASDKDEYRKYYKYYIPFDKAVFKEVDTKPSYRKFKSIDEFEYIGTKYQVFNMGESIIIRNKETLNESELVYGGYFINALSETLICLGALVFSLDELFKKYEFHINNSVEEWHPFGIKEW